MFAQTTHFRLNDADGKAKLTIEQILDITYRSDEMVPMQCENVPQNGLTTAWVPMAQTKRAAHNAVSTRAQ